MAEEEGLLLVSCFFLVLPVGGGACSLLRDWVLCVCVILTPCLLVARKTHRAASDIFLFPFACLSVCLALSRWPRVCVCVRVPFPSLLCVIVVSSLSVCGPVFLLWFPAKRLCPHRDTQSTVMSARQTLIDTQAQDEHKMTRSTRRPSHHTCATQRRR